MNRYPDMGVSALHAAIANKLGVDVGQGRLRRRLGGSALPPAAGDVRRGRRGRLCLALVRGLPDRGGPDRRYVGVQVPLTSDACHDLPAMAAAVTPATKVVVVCTPNNPTGPAVAPRRAAQLHRCGAHPRRGCSRRGLPASSSRTPTPSTGSSSPRGRDNVVVLRTFSKAYGLAGLRVGYAVGPASVAEAIRKCALPFGVSAGRPGGRRRLAGAEDASAGPGRRAGRRARAGRWRRLREQGWQVPAAQGNFVWFGLGDQRSTSPLPVRPGRRERAPVRRRRRARDDRGGRGQRHLARRLPGVHRVSSRGRRCERLRPISAGDCRTHRLE